MTHVNNGKWCWEGSAIFQEWKMVLGELVQVGWTTVMVYFTC